MSKWPLVFFIVLLISAFVGTYTTAYFRDLLSSPQLNTRLFVQIVSYFNVLLIFLIVRRECIVLGNADKLLKSFVWTTTILTIYGFYQYFANQLGLPFRGIVYSEGGVGTASVKTIDDIMFRVNSFANEPKRLTYFMVIGILILLKFKSYYFSYLGRPFTWLLIIGHIVILWWTYSTSIYFSVAVFLLGLLIYSIFINYNPRLLGTLIFSMLIGGVGYLYQEQEVEELYEVRVVDQLEYEEVRQEYYGWDYMVKYPGHFVTGLGPGMYNFALALEFPGLGGLSSNGRILKPYNSALLVYLFDFGIVGFIVMLFPMLFIFLSKRLANNKFSILVFFIYCTAITLDPTPTLFLLLGAFDAEQTLRNSL
tara:strand:- start:431 stop:1528 length:1098 start_codon:yes stop_codon:yes gene_type:complete